MWLDDFQRDLWYALRTLARSPGFAAVAILTLALGIGANTAIFSLVNTVMLRSLPVEHPEQLVETLYQYPRDPRLNSFAWKDYQRFREQNSVFSDLLAMSPSRVQVTRGTLEPDIVDGVYVPGNFFDGLGLRPAIGRLIGREDDRPGAADAAVAVISWSYWQSRFNRNPAVLGTSLTVNGVSVTIIGVTPREFFGLQLGMSPGIWLPVSAEPLLQTPSRMADGSLFVSIIGRLKPDVSIAQAQAEMRVLDQPRRAELEARTHDVQWRRVILSLEPAGAGLSILRDRFASSLLLILWTAGVLLLVACVNIASMLLARGAARRREMTVRTALGAGRLRIVRQVLTESLLLSAVGGLCGIAAAYVGARGLVALIASGRSPVGMPQPLDIPVQLDWHVLLFALAATAATGVLFGLVPAWHAFVSAPASSFRGVSATETPTWRRFGKTLVVMQVALSMILLSAAALFVQHLTDLRTIGTGFRVDGVLQVRLDWSRSGYSPAELGQLNHRVLDRLATVPGVRSATLAGITPISGAGGSQFITVQGVAENPDDRRRVSMNSVAPKYFETLGTPFIAGRDFAPEDEGRARVAIVNQAMARYYFGASSPLGRQFTIDGQPQPLEIIGVVADSKYGDLHDTPPRTMFLDAFQSGGASRIFVLRTDVRPTSVVTDVRRAVHEILPNVPIAKITTLAEQVDASILPERLIAMMSALFGVLAAMLVAMGLYALLAYTVTRRLREIGIRIALGATRGDITGMVMRNALLLVGAGLVIGGPIAFFAKGYADGVLTIVAATQAEKPITLSGGTTVPLIVASVAMIAVALLASYVPVRRATAVDPMTALRTE